VLLHKSPLLQPGWVGTLGNGEEDDLMNFRARNRTSLMDGTNQTLRGALVDDADMLRTVPVCAIPALDTVANEEGMKVGSISISVAKHPFLQPLYLSEQIEPI
jgi:hypothetical protein